jgi:hypothetical protein
VDNQELVDQQLDESDGQLLGRPLGLVGRLLPQINHPANEVVNQAVDQPLDELAGRPVRQRKRRRVAFEAEDEPIVQVRAPRRKRQKRTG